MTAQLIIDASYFAAAFLFIYGLKRMSSPVTARSGILVAGVGMLVAVLASFLYYFGVNDAALPHLGTNLVLAVTALAIGTGSRCHADDPALRSADLRASAAPADVPRVSQPSGTLRPPHCILKRCVPSPGVQRPKLNVRAPRSIAPGSGRTCCRTRRASAPSWTAAT